MNRFLAAVAVLFGICFTGHAQEPKSYPHPPSLSGVYYLQEDLWVPMKPLQHSGIKLRGQGLWPITSLKHRAVYPGKTSSNHTSAAPVFCVLGVNVAAEAAVLRTKGKKGNRELQIWNLANMDAPQRPNTEDFFRVTVGRAEGCSILRTEVGQLPAGEYVLTLDGHPASSPIYDFTVPKNPRSRK